MNITYISSFNATDINSYSGTGYFIPKKLQESGEHVDFIGNLSQLNPFYQKLKSKYYKILGKNYLIERNPHVLKLWAEKIKKQINPKTQVLVGYSSQPFAKIDIKKPKIFWSDAVFANMVDYYPVYSNLCHESFRDGNLMEKEALQNTTLAVYSSEWAARAAVAHYNIPEEKIRVIPYGANIEVNHSLKDISAMAKSKPFGSCNLLFLGVEWYRKGGDIAVEAARYLNQQGLKTRLSIVGVDPGESVRNLDFVKTYGYISKSDKKGLELFNKIVAESHFLILPTRADCTPIVYSEFNAYGIPVITTNEGGIPTVVRNGINGYMFDKNSGPEEYAGHILNLFADTKKYHELSKSSFNEYKTRLNWESSIKKFREVLAEAI